MGFGSTSTISTTENKLGALSIQSSTYGLPINLIWGTTRVTGNMIWYGDFVAIPHTQTQSSGGGGKGGGGVTSSNTTYTYTCALMLALCEGVIAGIGKIWSGKDKTTPAILGLNIFAGAPGQTPWSFLTGNHPDQALSYPALAYVSNSAFDLGNSASLPNLSFEVQGARIFGSGIVDAMPDMVLSDFMTSPVSGVGFASAKLGDLTAYKTYTQAMGLFISPALTQQQQAAQTVTDLMLMSNSEVVWSQALLKVVPYGDTAVTGNGVTYTPNITPVYDLTDDDFLGEAASDPIEIKRKTQADAYNVVQIEFMDRAADYNLAIAEATDLANIDMYGRRPQSPMTMHGICDRTVADKVASTILQRTLYIRNTYEFKLGWRFCLLEPMDIVTLTHSKLDLNLLQVRINEISEDPDGELSIIAEEFPFGVASPPKIVTQVSSGYSADFNISPGNVNPPVIFEAPDTLTVAGLEVFIGASGGPLWGGCEVWVSSDNATYAMAGKITTRARTGYLSANLPAGLDPDIVNTLSADLTESAGSMISGTQADADAYNTLCYVDGELISYSTATLTAVNKYNLTGYMRRGAFNSAIASHLAGTKFCRIDGALFHYPFSADRIGQTVYIKFVSYNIYGGGTQSMADVQAYQYKLTGSAQNSPLPNVVNLTTRYIDGMTQITWDVVSDYRTPIDYEVRLGATWSSAKTLGRTPTTSFSAVGNGTYWIAAHFVAQSDVHVYSANPSEIVISGAALVSNVIANYDEAATGWAGTLSSALNIQNNEVFLQGAGNILTLVDVLTTPDMIWYGGVAASGEYDLPPGHAVNVGRVAPCVVMMSYSVRGQSIYDNVLSLANVLAVTDWLGDALGAVVNVQPQIAMAGADGIYGAWQNFLPGTYNAQYYKARVLITSSNAQVTAVLSSLTFSVDMPDRVVQGSVAISAGGQSILYSPAFNGGVNGNPVPLPQITVLNAQQGDDVLLTAQTLSGFTVQVINGGVGVARTINYTSQGF